MAFKSTIIGTLGGLTLGAGMGGKKGMETGLGLGLKFGFVVGMASGIIATKVFELGKNKIEEKDVLNAGE